MAEHASTRRLDFAPRWVVPGLQSLAIDLPNGRVLCATRRDVRALDLESGEEILRFEGDGIATSDRYFLFSMPAQRAVSYPGGAELVAWDTTSGKIASRAAPGIPGGLDSISDDARLGVIGVIEPVTDPARFWDRDTSFSVVEIATGRVRAQLGRFRAAQSRSTIVSNDGTVLLCDREGRFVEFDPAGKIVRDFPALPVEPPPEGTGAMYPMLGDQNGGRTVQEIAPVTEPGVLVRSLSDSMVRNRVTGERMLLVNSNTMMETIVVSGDRTRLYRRPMQPSATDLVQHALTGETERLAGYGHFDWYCTAESGGVIVTSDYSANVRVIRQNRPRPLALALDRINAMPESIALSPDGRSALIGATDQSLRLLDLERGTIRPLLGHYGSGLAVGFLDGGRMWSCSSDHHRVWSPEGRVDRDEIYLGSTYGNPTTSHGGRFIYGVREASITVRRSDSGRLHRERVLGMTGLREGGALLEDGVTYYSAGETGFARWNLETGERTAEVLNARFTDQFGGTTATPEPAGAFVVLSGAYVTYIWEPDSDLVRVIPRLHSVSRARFFGNRLLAVGDHEDDPASITSGTRIHVIDLERLVRVDVLTGPVEPIRAFTAVKDQVAAISEDRVVFVWPFAGG